MTTYSQASTITRSANTTTKQQPSSAYFVAKRVFDIVAAGSALLLLAPVLLFIALAVKLYDRGPVLFWQTRIGEDGDPFQFPKFRSMVVNAEALRAKLLEQNQHGAAGVTFKMRRDPRVTPVGRILRRFSLDEVPQLWCVLTGQMSMVGPRPALPVEVDRYTPAERGRLAAKPGITCIWQVSGRGDIPFAQQVEMDMDYIQNRSLLRDIQLLLATIPAVLTGRGAY